MTGLKPQTEFIWERSVGGVDPMRRPMTAPLRSSLVLLFVSALLGQGGTDRDRAVAEIRRLGGRVQVDPARPGKPVIEVDLSLGKDAPGVAGDKQLEALRHFPELRRLYLGGTRVTGDGLAQLRPLKDLRQLDLRGTSVTGAGLGHLKAAVPLEGLNLFNCPVDDKDLAGLKDFPSLEALDLGGTRVTDAGLTSLTGLERLESLALSDTKVSGKGLEPLKGLKRLRNTTA